MTDKIDTEYLEEGDSFEGGPLEQSSFISEVLAAGGSVKIHGNKVHITSLPKKEASKAKASASSKKPAEAPKKEEAKEEAPKKEAPKAEEPKKEAKPEETSKDVSDDKTKE